MTGKKRRIRFSILAAIGMLLLFALIFAPWAYFSRKAVVKKIDDKLSRRREKATDFMTHTEHIDYLEYSDSSSVVTQSTGIDHDPYRYTDSDGETYSIREFKAAPPSFSFWYENGTFVNFGTMEYDDFYVGSVDDDLGALYADLLDEMDEIDLDSINYDDWIYGTVPGHRYLLSKGQIKVVTTYPATTTLYEDNSTEEYMDRFMVFCEDMEPYIDEWQQNMEKNLLALIITWLTAVTIIVVLEERSGAKGLYTAPGEEEKTEAEAITEAVDEGREFMSSEAAKALLSDLEQAEQVMGDNGYTKQIRDEISKYL